MLGHDALARLPVAVAFRLSSDVPLPLAGPVYNVWHGAGAKTGYCASVTLQFITINSGLAAGVTLQINGFELMSERGGLI